MQKPQNLTRVTIILSSMRQCGEINFFIVHLMLVHTKWLFSSEKLLLARKKNVVRVSLFESTSDFFHRLCSINHKTIINFSLVQPLVLKIKNHRHNRRWECEKSVVSCWRGRFFWIFSMKKLWEFSPIFLFFCFFHVHEIVAAAAIVVVPVHWTCTAKKVEQ